MGFVVDDFHATTAQYIRWANQHRITDFVGHGLGLLKGDGGAVLWCRQAGFLQNL